MDGLERVTHGGRETRLLLVTIAVSIGVLLLLSRFRFPEQAAEPPATPSTAPLDRLAARAAYDELASTMADLERQLTGSVLILQVQPQRESGGFVVAPRLTPDRAVALLRPGEALPGDSVSTSRIIASDPSRELAVVGVGANEAAVVVPRFGAPRAGPRYVVAVEGTADGLTLRPVYVGRTSQVQDERTSTPMLLLGGLQHSVTPGAAIFSLEGTFIGIVTGGGTNANVVPGDFLKTLAETVVPAGERPRGDFGVRVEPLTEALARATAAPRGVIVNDVAPQGPSANLLLPGDVIQSVGGAPVTSIGTFRQLEQAATPGQPIALSVLRRRAVTDITIRAINAGTGLPTPVDQPGFVLRGVEGRGIEVVSVEGNTPAARAGLQGGDLIIAVDGRPAADAEAFNRGYGSASAGTAWVLTVQRGLRRHTFALEKR
jgi:S1-C subfamily serine protease